MTTSIAVSISFTLEAPNDTHIVVDEAVREAVDVQLASGKTYIPFGEPTAAAETFIVPHGMYRVGDILKMEQAK